MSTNGSKRRRVLARQSDAAMSLSSPAGVSVFRCDLGDSAAAVAVKPTVMA